MTTFIVDKKDVDKVFTLQDLLEFSKKPYVRVIIRKFAMLENGIVRYLV
jgi:hypothetical protein